MGGGDDDAEGDDAGDGDWDADDAKPTKEA
jgi:hypothetical protein